MMVWDGDAEEKEKRNSGGLAAMMTRFSPPSPLRRAERILSDTSETVKKNPPSAIHVFFWLLFFGDGKDPPEGTAKLRNY